MEAQTKGKSKALPIIIGALILVGFISVITVDDNSPVETSSTEEVAETKVEKIVTYDTKWSDDYNGLISEISKVDIYDDGKIRVTMSLKNTTSDRKFSTYSNQMTLITPDGKQAEANIFTGSELSGDIYDGVTKAGSFDIYTENTNAINYDQLRLVWNVTDLKDHSTKDYDVVLKLK